MWLTLLVGALVVIVLSRVFHKSRYDLHKIPGPSSLSLLRSATCGKMRQYGHKKFHLLMNEWADDYGPIMKIKDLTGKYILVVSDFEHIYEVLVTKGTEAGGRATFFRAKEVMGETSIMLSLVPGKKWKALRRITHGHLRQFGEGITKLQSLLNDVGQDMFEVLTQHENIPYDPRDIIEEAALKSIYFLLSGQMPLSGNPVVEILQQLNVMGREVFSTNPKLQYKILDAAPWLRHIGLSSAWTKIQQINGLQDRLVELLDEEYQSHPEVQSLYHLFKEAIESGSDSMTYDDLKHTAFTLMAAGVVTSTDTFYAMINLLAHHPHVQQKMYEEIHSVVPDKETITTAHRHELHYCKAVLLESFRYHSVSPMTAIHRTCTDVYIGKYLIPEDTTIIPLLWKLHHDPAFWKDPDNFRPERFLDDQGQIVPADHPNRKHLMPFGAGPRVCVAESMATIRLFLWSTKLMQNFTVRPGPGNEKCLIDSKKYTFEGTVQSDRYHVIFVRREQD